MQETSHTEERSLVQADDASMTMNPHEAAKKEAEETSEERAKRIASQWTKHDSSAPQFAPAPTFDEPQVGNLKASSASVAQFCVCEEGLQGSQAALCLSCSIHLSVAAC